MTLAFRAHKRFNRRTGTALNRTEFNGVSRTVNGGDHANGERWAAYQRGLAELRPGR